MTSWTKIDCVGFDLISQTLCFVLFCCCNIYQDKLFFKIGRVSYLWPPFLVTIIIICSHVFLIRCSCLPLSSWTRWKPVMLKGKCCNVCVYSSFSMSFYVCPLVEMNCNCTVNCTSISTLSLEFRQLLFSPAFTQGPRPYMWWPTSWEPLI